MFRSCIYFRGICYRGKYGFSFLGPKCLFDKQNLKIAYYKGETPRYREDNQSLFWGLHLKAMILFLCILNFALL